MTWTLPEPMLTTPVLGPDVPPGCADSEQKPRPPSTAIPRISSYPHRRRFDNETDDSVDPER